MKQNKKALLVCASTVLLGLSSISSIKTVKAEEKEEEYYVCFQSQNYNVKNANKLIKEGDHYILENVSLSSNNDFYVISSSKIKYLASDGTNMKVNDSSSYKYNIYFSPEYVYNQEKVGDSSLYVSNANLTYDIYIPGDYSYSINDGEEKSLSYNCKQNLFAQYYISEIYLHSGDVLKVRGKNKHEEEINEFVSSSIENDGYYRVIFTPGERKNGDAYALDKDGKYGSGEEYIYNFHIEDSEFYYVVFKNEMPNLEEKVNLMEGVSGYRLTRNEDYPNNEIYNSSQFFNNDLDKKVRYQIYYYSHILNDYELIDDDNDSSSTYSKFTLGDVSWYSLSFTVASDKYETTYKKESRDFEGYYMVGKFNNYGYDENGNVNIKGNSLYKFEKVGENDPNFEKDYEQYSLKYDLYLSDLDKDDNNFTFYITNGDSIYKDGNSLITLTTPGTYSLLFSKDHDYGKEKHFHYILEKNSTVFETFKINNVSDFLKYVDIWNKDSELSKYKIYEITSDLNFAGISVPKISVFNGEIRGNNHSILNLKYEDDTSSSVGLFDLVTKYAKIDSLNIKYLNIDAEDASYVGFVCKNYGTLSNIVCSGVVKGNQYVGGIVGYNGNYKINSTDESTDSSNSYGYGVLKNIENNVTVNGKVNVGGLAGFNGGKIISSKNNGNINVKSYSSSTKVVNIGGLCGYSTGQIVDSLNSGTVGFKGVGKNVGGLVGLSSGTFYFDKNIGSIEGKNNVGGIVGFYGNENNDNNKNSSSNPIEDITNSYLGNNSSNDIGYTQESDISKHLMYYCENKGKIQGTSYIGGIVGYSNSNDVIINSSISVGDIYANSGSYAGGISAYFNGGTIVSSFANCYLESNGSINQYVGGIAAYSNGVIKDCYSTSTLVGTEYLGGIVGYGTQSATIESCYTNVFILPKSTSCNVGNIAGFIQGKDESSSTYGDRIKYNYYVGSSSFNDLGGITKVNYGLTSKYSSFRLDYESLLCKDKLPSSLNHNFGFEETKENENEEDVDLYYYFASKEDKLNPQLKYFVEPLDVKDEDFDDNSSSYEAFSHYFNKYKEEYISLQEEATKPSIKVAFMEWNEDKGEIKQDNYENVLIKKVYLGENKPTFAPFTYAYLKDGKYYYEGKESSYIVSWDNINEAFVNQVVYSKYKGVKNSIEVDNFFIEGNFNENTTCKIKNDGNNYHFHFYEDGKEVIYEDIVIKFKGNSKKYDIKIDGNKIKSSDYGDYLKFNLASSESEITISQIPFNFKTMAPWLKILVIIIPLLLIFALGLGLYKTIRRDEKTNVIK